MAFSVRTGFPVFIALTAMMTAGLATSALALALDGDDFAAALYESQTTFGDFDYESIEVDRDTITFVDTIFYTFNDTEPDQELQIPVGDMVFSGVREAGDGKYLVDRLNIAKLSVANGETRLEASGIELTGLTFPIDQLRSMFDAPDGRSGYSVGPVSLFIGEQKVFSLGSIRGEIALLADGMRQETSLSASGLRFDLGQIEDMQTRQTMAQLGYRELRGDIALNTVWDGNSGVLNLNKYSLNLIDVGKVNMTFNLSGITREMVDSFNQMRISTAANPDRAAANQAKGIAMLGMMQQISLARASIRFDDASLTRRALAYVGQQQGVSGDQMGQAIKAMLPLMLGQYGMPGLQQQISAAVNSYLDAPRNMTVSAEPPAPVPISVLMGAQMNDPRQLANILNVTVTANR